MCTTVMNKFIRYPQPHKYNLRPTIFIPTNLVNKNFNHRNIKRENVNSKYFIWFEPVFATIAVPVRPVVFPHFVNSFGFLQRQRQEEEERQRRFWSREQLPRIASLEEYSDIPLINAVRNFDENCKWRRGQKFKSSRYKTELCRTFEESGECVYGTTCKFAHGVYELRSRKRHPKYKTKFCYTYHNTGYCSFGTRCHFVHNVDYRNFNNLAPAHLYPGRGLRLISILVPLFKHP